MIELNKISKFELRDLVEFSYKGDRELLDKYWGDDFSLDEAVNETMRMIDIVSQEAKMSYYAIEDDGHEIGYMCCIPNNLYSFGINIEYRTKRVKEEFWRVAKEVMGNSFICMLYPQNVRAIEFLKKMGMKVVDGVEQNCVTLLNI